MIHHHIMGNRAPAQEIPETYAGFGNVRGGDNNDYEAYVVDVVLLITYTNEVWMHDLCRDAYLSLPSLEIWVELFACVVELFACVVELFACVVALFARGGRRCRRFSACWRLLLR